MEHSEYFKERIAREEEHYKELYKKSFGIKGIILGILTFGTYQIGLSVNEMKRVGLQ